MLLTAKALLANLLLVGALLSSVGCAAGEPAATGETDLSPFRGAVLLDPAVAPPSSLERLANEAPAIRFDHLPPEAGLSQSVVLDIVQDDLGFLWLATQDGLNRYDGYEFTIYKAGQQDGQGLTGNLINALDKAPTGEIWIGGSDNGLTRYDPASGQFTPYLHDPDDPGTLSEDIVLSVDVDEAGLVWVGTANAGLNRLDPRTGVITRYLNGLSAPGVTSIAATDEAIWLGTYGGGLNRLDPVSGGVTVFRNDPADPDSIGNDIVNTVFVDGGGEVWVGTLGGGLNRLNPRTGALTRHSHDPDDPFSLSGDSVPTVLEDSDGQLWVGTAGGGLNLFDRAGNRFTRFVNDPFDADSLSSDYVQSLYEDASGILWIGTFGNGADRYDPYENKFLTLRANPQQPDRLASSNAWGVWQDRAGRLWLATNDRGVSRLDLATGEWRQYLHDEDDPQSIASDTVYGVYEDGGGVIWLGSLGGLSRYDPATDGFVNYPMAPAMAALEDSRGLFWVATMLGLVQFDRETGSIVHVYKADPGDPGSISSDAADILHEDNEGQLWVGTINGGLNRFDPGTGRFRRYVQDPNVPGSLSANVVLDVFQDSRDTLWVGTTGGLNRYVPATDSFMVYREQDGLPNDVVYCLLEDDAGHLWFSTNKGLVHFDPETLAMRAYDQSDGLQASEFNQWSCHQNDEGVMYFGGVNGLNAFHPGLIRDNPYVPPIVLTGFSIYNEEVDVSADGPLAKPLAVTDEIELDYTDDFFEFEYAALHYSSPGDIRYATMMEGLDTGWKDVGNRRYATFTSMPPGDYTFRVRATNSDGVWTENSAAIRVVIPPPFWETWWFRILAVVGLAGAVSAVFWLRLRGIEQQREKLEQQVEERTRELQDTMEELESARDAAESASRAKSTFLANMSHEFRTPLNAILGFTQIMARDRRLPPNLKSDVDIVRRSGEHLLGLINDVLDMSKIEAGRTTLRLTNFDLHDLLLGLEEMFALRAETKGLNLVLIQAADVPRYVRGDEGKLRQVLLNLLGNAVKFTAEGQVTIRVEVERVANGAAALLRFAIADTGPGIASEELAHLFDPFVQAKAGQESPEGTGLGLAISREFVRLMGGEIIVSSELGSGSVFAFTVPLEIAREQDLDRPRPVRQVIGLAPGQPEYRLLVVDDQEANRLLLQRILEPLGFVVRQAVNGQQAIDIWQEWEPHLIWMDMRMPVMDGYEATRRIKSTTQGMGTIVIAITASALEEDRAIILSQGCDDYVRKPFQEQVLYDVLTKHLGVRFLYESPAPGVGVDGTADSEGGEPTLDDLADRLAATDGHLLDALETAVLLGDIGAINDEVQRLGAHDATLRQALEQMARNFEHDGLLALITAAREKEEQHA